MEPISGVASVLTLIDSTAILSKAVLKLIREIQDTPQELQRLTYHIEILSSAIRQQLRFYKTHCLGQINEIPGPLFDEQDVSALQNALRHAEHCVDAIQKSMVFYKGSPTTRRRLQWVVKDRKPVLQLVDYVRKTQHGLMNMLATISV